MPQDQISEELRLHRSGRWPLEDFLCDGMQHTVEGESGHILNSRMGIEMILIYPMHQHIYTHSEDCSGSLEPLLLGSAFRNI